MSVAPPNLTRQDVIERLESASRQLREGRRPEAAAALRGLAVAAPAVAEVRRLLGVALSEMGDQAGARAAFQEALRLEPAMGRAAIGLAEVLVAAGDAREAVATLRPMVGKRTTNFALLTAFGNALQSAGHSAEAADVLGRAHAVDPDSAVGEHNLANALVDMQSLAAADRLANSAAKRGLDAPEAWFLRARIALGQARLSDAEAALREALARRPHFAKAIAELAHTVWVRSADRGETLAVFSEVFAHTPPTAELLLHKARLLSNMGDHPAAYGAVDEALALGDGAGAHAEAAQQAVWFDAALAMRHARQANRLEPENPDHAALIAQVNLALGRPEETVRITEALRPRLPDEQYLLALLATAWRAMGDERYLQLHDYGRLVESRPLEPPAGWSRREDFLADLRPALRAMHRDRGHPAGQSLRGGTQSQQSLVHSDHPAIRGLVEAVRGPIEAYLARLGSGRDPVRRRLTGAHAFSGFWSVLLRPGGFHVDHVHTKGWISSALHIELPSSVDHGREGWLKFGEPGVPTSPALPADHHVKPVAGELVLFPSYMWHGTVPFTGEETRLAAAFDLIPA